MMGSISLDAEQIFNKIWSTLQSIYGNKVKPTIRDISERQLCWYLINTIQANPLYQRKWDKLLALWPRQTPQSRHQLTGLLYHCRGCLATMLTFSHCNKRFATVISMHSKKQTQSHDNQESVAKRHGWYTYNQVKFRYVLMDHGFSKQTLKSIFWA